MLGTPTYRIKPLSRRSTYFLEYTSADVKGDKALLVFGKSEVNGFKKFWWDSIKKDYLPWRGGTVVTNRGTFCFCVYITWWANGQKNPKKLLKRLAKGTSIESEDSNRVSIYFWKSNNEYHNAYSTNKTSSTNKFCKSSKKVKN